MHNGHFLQQEHVMWNPSATAGLRQKVFSFENLCRFCGSIQKELKVLQEIKRWIFGKIAFDPTPLIFRNLVSIFFRKTSEKKKQYKGPKSATEMFGLKMTPQGWLYHHRKSSISVKIGSNGKNSALKSCLEDWWDRRTWPEPVSCLAATPAATLATIATVPVWCPLSTLVRGLRRDIGGLRGRCYLWPQKCIFVKERVIIVLLLRRSCSIWFRSR